MFDSVEDENQIENALTALTASSKGDDTIFSKETFFNKTLKVSFKFYDNVVPIEDTPPKETV